MFSSVFICFQCDVFICFHLFSFVFNAMFSVFIVFIRFHQQN